MIIRRLRVKTAAVAALAVLSVGGMAAEVFGLAPASLGRAAPSAASTPGGQLAHAQGDAAATLTQGAPAAAARDVPVSAKSGDRATGPDASGAARDGLCQAWLAGEGDANGRRMDAVAFRALAAAAGGTDQVPAFCQADVDVSAEPGRPQATPPSRAPKTPPPASGPVERPDQGHGQGGPPTTS